jgi:hypothetical protein
MRYHGAVVLRLRELSLGIEPGDLRGQLVFSEFVIDIGLALKEGYRIVEFRYDRFCLLPLRGLGRDLLIETIDLRLVLRQLRNQLLTLRIGESWVCARRGTNVVESRASAACRRAMSNSACTRSCAMRSRSASPVVGSIWISISPAAT